MKREEDLINSGLCAARAVKTFLDARWRIRSEATTAQPPFRFSRGPKLKLFYECGISNKSGVSKPRLKKEG